MLENAKKQIREKAKLQANNSDESESEEEEENPDLFLFEIYEKEQYEQFRNKYDKIKEQEKKDREAVEKNDSFPLDESLAKNYIQSSIVKQSGQHSDPLIQIRNEDMRQRI